MDLNTAVKIVYKDNYQTKCLKGILIKEDIHTYTLMMEHNSKIVVIGKNAIIKATYDDKMSRDS